MAWAWHGMCELALNVSVYRYIQGVPRVKVTTSGECSLGQTIRYNPKHLYPKFNGYGDIVQRSLKL